MNVKKIISKQNYNKKNKLSEGNLKNNNLIFSKSKSHSKVDSFKTLLPIVDADKNDFYYNEFMTAVEEKAKIIAFSGNYGVGKSSVINSIIKKLNIEENYVRVMLGNFNNIEAAQGPNVVPSLKEESTTSLRMQNNLELKILQQIMYRKDTSNLSQSRITRIKYTKKDKGFYNDISASIFLILLFLFQNSYIELLVKIIKLLKNINLTITVLCLIVLNIIIFCASMLILNKIIAFVYGDINSIKLKIGTSELSLDVKSQESAFNKYLDEIVYFFSKTKINLMIIEDLDRYGKVSLNLFQSLRDLNILLNSNEIISKNNGVIFVYAIKDDLFASNDDRVKFFDVIIPIVPMVSSGNAYEFIKNNFPLASDIDQNLLKMCSMYIQDYRTIINTFNEYSTYAKIYSSSTNIINKNKLFAMICYKNNNILNFSKLSSHEGNLYHIFEYKSKFIEKIKKTNKEKLEVLNEKLSNYNGVLIKDTEILKSAFFMQNLSHLNFYGYLSQVRIEFNYNDNYTYDEFLELDVSQYENANRIVLHGQSSGTYEISIEDFKELVSKIKIIKTDFELLHKEISEKEAIINDIDSLTMKEIVSREDFNLETFNSSENSKDKYNENLTEILEDKFLLLLIRTGYIDEEYERILTYFIAGGIAKSDYVFIMSMDINDKLDYKYHLISVKDVIKSSNITSFNNESALNYDMFLYFLSVKNFAKNEDKKRKILFEQFESMTQYKFDFLDSFRNLYPIDFEKLIFKVFNDNIYKYIIENGNNDLINIWIKEIVENVVLKDKMNNEELIKDLKFKIENSNIISQIAATKYSEENLIFIKPLFTSYESVPLEFIELLYNNDLFKSNYSFYSKYLKTLELDEKYYKTDCLDAIYNEKMSSFRKKLFDLDINEFNLFMDKFETLGNVETILNFLNDKNAKIELKENVLKHFNNKNGLNVLIDTLNSINEKGLWSIAITDNIIENNMENIVEYYNYSEEIDDTLLKMIEGVGTEFKSIEKDGFDNMLNDLLYSKEIQNYDYSYISKCYSNTIEKLSTDKAINSKLIGELILNNKIALNEEIYNVLLPYDELILSLISKKQEDYIRICSEYNKNYDLFRKIFNSKINTEFKINLLNYVELEQLGPEVVNNFSKEIIENKSSIENEDIGKMMKNIDLNEKIDFLIYAYSLDTTNIKYLELIYPKIRNGISSTTSIENTESNMKLATFLKDNHIITDFKIVLNKIKLSYKKSEILV